MKIALCSQGENLESPLDDRFGRCSYLLLYNSSNEELQVEAGPGASAEGGAGVQTAQAIVNIKPDVLVTMNIGPNAIQVLQAAGIDIYGTNQCSGREAVELLLAGKLKLLTNSTVKSHHQ